MMDVRFLLGQSVRFRGRVGTVVRQDALTDVMARRITIRFSDGEETNVPSYLWPWVRILHENED